jgi:hypothetical protein
MNIANLGMQHIMTNVAQITNHQGGGEGPRK